MRDADEIREGVQVVRAPVGDEVGAVVTMLPVAAAPLGGAKLPQQALAALLNIVLLQSHVRPAEGPRTSLQGAAQGNLEGNGGDAGMHQGCKGRLSKGSLLTSAT